MAFYVVPKKTNNAGGSFDTLKPGELSVGFNNKKGRPALRLTFQPIGLLRRGARAMLLFGDGPDFGYARLTPMNAGNILSENGRKTVNFVTPRLPVYIVQGAAVRVPYVLEDDGSLTFRIPSQFMAAVAAAE